MSLCAECRGRWGQTVLFIKGTRDAPLCGFSDATINLLNEECCPVPSSAGCLVCCHAVLRQRAVQIGCNYETVDTLDEENNPGLRESLKAFSQWPTIPQLYVGGEFMGGADVAREMHESGELKQAVAEALQARAAAAADFVTLCQAHHSPPQPVSPGPQHQGNYSRLVLGHTGAGG